MKVFVSWSGARSKAVAELLVKWVGWNLQAAKPWISTHDIERGAVWFSRIASELSETSIGIFCLTPQNKAAPWILFEAGALSKGSEKARVCTFLVDLRSADIEDPLAQFNHSDPSREGMWALLQTLNLGLGEGKLSEASLEDVFDTYWPRFKLAFDSLPKETTAFAPPPRSQDSILGEILENTRNISQRMAAADTLALHSAALTAASGWGGSRPLRDTPLGQAPISDGEREFLFRHMAADRSDDYIRSYFRTLILSDPTWLEKKLEERRAEREGKPHPPTSPPSS